MITTCSPRNFEYLKSLGADEVHDYSSDLDALAKDINSRTDNKLTLAFDCSPTEASAQLCAKAMSTTVKGTYCAILRVEPKVIASANPKVEPRFILAYSIFGAAFKRYGFEFPAKPEDLEFGIRWWEVTRETLAAGKVKTARMDVNRGGEGLEGVVKGLQELKDGKVSGTKLVYTI